MSSSHSHRWKKGGSIGRFASVPRGLVRVDVFLWFWLRQARHGSIGTTSVERIQRRLIHIFTQRIDQELTQRLRSKMWAENAQSLSRKEKGKTIQMELLRRFLGRNSGFLGTQTAANSDLMEEGLVKGNSEGTVCAAHYSAVYWMEAASALCEAIGQSPIPSLSVYHDAAEVCGHETNGKGVFVWCGVSRLDKNNRYMRILCEDTGFY